MPKAERNVVTPPNQKLMGINERRSATPAASPSAVREPNQNLRDGDPSAYGGNPLLHKAPGGVRTPDHRFDVNNANIGAQPPAADMPGSGMIPVDLKVGMPATGFARMDTAKK